MTICTEDDDEAPEHCLASPANAPHSNIHKALLFQSICWNDCDTRGPRVIIRAIVDQEGAITPPDAP